MVKHYEKPPFKGENCWNFFQASNKQIQEYWGAYLVDYSHQVPLGASCHHVHGSSQIGTTYVVPYALGTFEFNEASKCNPVRVKPFARVGESVEFKLYTQEDSDVDPKVMKIWFR